MIFFLISSCKAGFVVCFGFVCLFVGVFFKLDFMAACFERAHSPVVSDLIYDDFLEELKEENIMVFLLLQKSLIFDTKEMYISCCFLT